VSDETWQRVRARDTPATYGSRNARPKYPLSGLLLCAECGRAMTLCGGKNSRGFGSQRYVCPNYKEHGTVGCSNYMGVSRAVAEELIIEPLRERLLNDQSFLAAVSALEKSEPENSEPKNRSLVSEPNGARPNAISGSVFTASSDDRDPMQAFLAAMGWSPSHAHTEHVETDEASLLANAKRLRTALLSAATDALRDALRRTLGTVRCQPTVEGESRYLWAQFEGGDVPLLEWLAIGEAANQPGLSALVAGAGFALLPQSIRVHA
jgi:hypothetical protein